jgi:hypothetical protein
MIQEAKKLGLKTMVGCMTESSVGISAMHIYYHNYYVDMDGALLLAEDIANGVTIKTEKSAILSETELEFFTINTHESQSVSRQNN